MFDSEYKGKSRLVKRCVYSSSLLTVNGSIDVAFNILLNPVASFIERSTPLDNGSGSCVFYEKV